MIGDVTREREATVGVDRGLFLLRYASGPATGASPVAVVRPTAGSEAFVEVFSAPGVVNGFLAAPGDCTVIRAEQAARLTIKIKAHGADGSLDASFRLEPVAGAGVARVAAAEPKPSIAASGTPEFQILAHVARRGDVAVNPGSWLAGPDAPAAIEGVEIRGALPVGLGVELQPLVATNPPRWLDWAAQGVFVGTRGRALPLAGLRFRLTGDQSFKFQLSVDGLFLGSAVVSKKGREIELVGPAGNDPLVGLRVGLAAQVEATDETFAPQAPVSAEAGVVGRQKEPRIRVFRASTEA